MELGPADVVFDGPHHPYTEALLSAVPTIDGGGRERIRLEGDIPSAAEPPSGCVFHNALPAQGGRDLRRRPSRRSSRSRRATRCAVTSRSTSSACCSGRRRRAREDQGMRCSRAWARRRGWRSSTSPSPTRTRCSSASARAACAAPTTTPSTARRAPVAGRARARGRRRRRGGRRGGHARRARRPRHALVDAVVRGVLGVPPRPAAAVLDDLAADGGGRSLRRDLPALARRPRPSTTTASSRPSRRRPSSPSAPASRSRRTSPSTSRASSAAR